MVKIKLPQFGRGRDSAIPSPPGSVSLARVLRMARRGALYSFVTFFFVILFAWLNFPKGALSWRITHEAKKAGLVITVEDVDAGPTGSATIKGLTWHFAPSHKGQEPVPWYVETIEADLSVLEYLIFDDIDVEVEAMIGEDESEGMLKARYEKSEEEAKLHFEMIDVPLYNLPKFQQALNAPAEGTWSMEVDLTMPEGKWAQANGSIDLSCRECAIGDGETKLYMPGVKKGLLKEGLTVPIIHLGDMDGHLEVVDGVATAEEFVSQSEDIIIKVSGQILFKDPVKRSRLELIFKVKVSDELQKKDEKIQLLVTGASAKAKMDKPDEGWLGYRLRGYFGRPTFMGIKAKTKEEKLRDAREKRRGAIRERQARSKARADARKKNKKSTRTKTGAKKPQPKKGGDNPVEVRPKGVKPVPEGAVGKAMPAAKPPTEAEPPPPAEEPEEEVVEDEEEEVVEEEPEEEDAEEQPEENEGGDQGGEGGEPEEPE